MHWCQYASIIIVTSIVYCEFIADYIPLWYCQWPLIKTLTTNGKQLKAMILADTHLIGPIKGHWLDQFYREWHMSGAYQAAIRLHQPNVVFILGDLFDEGDLVHTNYFKEYVKRFKKYFHISNRIPVMTVAGNHDIGFHYKMRIGNLMKRFKTYFNNTGVQLYNINNINFVVINSMAMENDGCHICEKAKSDLLKVADKLNCLKNWTSSCDNINSNAKIDPNQIYSAPILLQHFPTYRPSDAECIEHDSPYIELYRENWEILSKNSTDWLGEILQPRLAFAGHSHHYCRSINRWNVEEYTLASFNWRNKIEPSFLMVTFTPTDYAVFKCDMLKQHNVLYAYVFACILFTLLVMWILLQKVIYLVKNFVY